MKTTTKTMLALIALSTSALIVNAQDGRPWGHRPPPSPLMHALDANHDGVIDADEIANASAALKTLDKNGDGKLTQDELRPPRPPRGEGRPPGSDGDAPQQAPAANN
ncbi:MAG TPA: EF-hand domain-containing protein [Candidatus Angelobacter sp.]|nr:EF-hand domain-containing protein [Candidatus Angelobacter sp.]